MKRMYLAQFVLEKNLYMGDTIRTPLVRLVVAESLDEAEDKLRREFDRSSHGGDSVSVEDLDLTRAIE